MESDKTEYDIKTEFIFPEKVKKIHSESLITPIFNERQREKKKKKESPILIKYSHDLSCNVTCNPFIVPENNAPSEITLKKQLELLSNLGNSPNILKFYGISQIENDFFMINEWAESGNLKELYESYDIDWYKKVCGNIIVLQNLFENGNL